MPCAFALLAVVFLLGPPLGDALFSPPPLSVFWNAYAFSGRIRPETTEHARYLIALLGPFALSAATVAAVRRRQRHSPATDLAMRASQLLLLAFVVLCFVAQRGIVYDGTYGGTPIKRVYFNGTTLVVSVAIAAAIAAALRSRATIARLTSIARETRLTRLTATAAALLLTAIWLLTAMNTDGTIGATNVAVLENIPFWLDESMAILNGRAPLVDFHAQYGQLWSYLGAGTMSILGASFGVYAGMMVAGTAGALLAVFALLRRVAGSSLAALALYAPFVATGFFTEIGPPENRYGPANLFSLFPIRYAGAYLLAWLTVRHIGGARPRRPFPLFVLAGLVLVNNVEFGAPALGATIAAIAWTDPLRSWTRIVRLLGVAAVGVAAAVALVSLLTVAVAGSMPHFGMLLTFPRIYGLAGFGMMPMPSLGFHVLMYATFAAAIAVASVRAIARSHDDQLTGMLAWAGVFGMGAGSYYAGRSHPDVLIDIFSAWALALALLLVVTVRTVLARTARRPTAAELLVLAGFGVAVCSLGQTPAPWTQIERLRAPTAAPVAIHTAAERFVAQATKRGEPVALLMVSGHRIAYDVGVVNVTPYANIESMMTIRQLDETIAALRGAHGRKLFLPPQRGPTTLYQERADAIVGAGFRLVRQDRRSGVVELVDRRPGG